MGRVQIQQNGFTGGEISPRLFGRTDIAKYANSVATMQNVTPLVHGGARKRYGTGFVAPTKFQDRKGRLIPYVVNRDLAYMLEFGDASMRVFKSDGSQVGASGVPYEIATPFTEAMIGEMDYAQGPGWSYLAHSQVPIQRLRRFSDTLWTLEPAPFTTTPFAEIGDYPPIVLTIPVNTAGAGRSITAASSVFMASDVGRVIIAGPGNAIITGYVSGTAVSATIKTPFLSGSLAAGGWNLDSSPNATLTQTVNVAEIAILMLDSAVDDEGAGGDAVRDKIRALQELQTIGAPMVLTLDADGWRPGDIGKFVRINGGLARIISTTDARIAIGEIVKVMGAVVPAPPLAWSLESSQWGGVKGYPRTVSIFQQRLIAAGSPGYPTYVWGSRTGEELDFTLGTVDSDAFAFPVSADETNPIAFVASMRDLLVLTYGGEFTLSGGVEKPITPTSVTIRHQTAHGSNTVRPVQVGNEMLFVQRAGRKLRAMSYVYTRDGYVSPDLSVLAEHVTGGDIVGMAFQQEPDQILWAIRGDGVLLSMTFDRDQDVTGWARHSTDGLFEDAAVLSTSTGDELWCIVCRTVNGSVQRYVERMIQSWQPTVAMDWGYMLDCAVEFDFPEGSATLAGLDHLEGKTVAVIADGFVLEQRVVAGGQITMERPAYRVLAGLSYQPVIEMLRPEVAGAAGTAQGTAMSTPTITVRFLDSVNAIVNGMEVDARKFGSQLLDQAPQMFSGDLRVENLGWERGKSPITITQTDPCPLHVLSVIRTFSTNAG